MQRLHKITIAKSTKRRKPRAFNGSKREAHTQRKQKGRGTERKSARCRFLVAKQRPICATNSFRRFYMLENISGALRSCRNGVERICATKGAGCDHGGPTEAPWNGPISREISNVPFRNIPRPSLRGGDGGRSLGVDRFFADHLVANASGSGVGNGVDVIP